MKEQNRQNFPICAKIIDEFRKVFGDVKVLWVSENGKEQGSRKVIDENRNS